jgi:hypothetical protein
MAMNKNQGNQRREPQRQPPRQEETRVVHEVREPQQNTQRVVHEVREQPQQQQPTERQRRRNNPNSALDSMQDYEDRVIEDEW